jgi:type IV secretion system protein VirB6
MQQGGMGLILTTLILTAPPMAAFFFQGTLGSFMAYSQIGGAAGAQPGPQGQSPGSYTPQQTQNNNVNSHTNSNQVSDGRAYTGTHNAPAPNPDTGRLGAANKTT